MDPWYKTVTPRREVREGRSFNPDEFAIHLEQVIAKTAPADYRDPEQFFARTCFTRALREHAGMVLRRLAGRITDTAPVMTLITQFGGGKTHTLAALYHLATGGGEAGRWPGVADLLREAGAPAVPEARVAAFVGNAWDPGEGRETPWLDLARQLAGDRGVRELGPAAKTTPPGTDAIGRVFRAADGPVLLLFDEVLNFLNRHRAMAEPFHAFIQNLTVATTATTHGAAVVSLPRSQVEMTDWDMQWQDRITKVIRRVAKDLIANDETEISEVVRRRLFGDAGHERHRKRVSKAYADWCFERRAQLPPEWTAVDSAATEAKAREYLRSRFETCFPFHPATLSVFQRKWQALAQYQQTRGTLAMLAQWISWAWREGFTKARTEPLVTLGSAPLEVPEFRSAVLGQLGESRLVAAIDADVCGAQAHARALDADTKGSLRNIHRRVGTTILFESSGGQIDKVAHLPELRFALGEPAVDTTSVDSAAFALEDKSWFIRRTGSDGFRIGHQPTMRKVVSDRRASLDEDAEVRPAMRQAVRKEFERGASLPVVPFPADGSAIPDTPRLTLVVVDPESDWTGAGQLRERIREWTVRRGKSPRLYPAALVWCVKQPGRGLRDKVELMLAWKRVAREVAEGVLGGDFDRADRAGLQSRVADAGEAVKDEVWAGYRFVVLADAGGLGGLGGPGEGGRPGRPGGSGDGGGSGGSGGSGGRDGLGGSEGLGGMDGSGGPSGSGGLGGMDGPGGSSGSDGADGPGQPGGLGGSDGPGGMDGPGGSGRSSGSDGADGLKIIDLGAGHASAGDSLCARVVTALKSQALLNESVGAGYVERNWPPALAASGAWPLASLRQSFLNGSLTRLLDPDATLRAKIVEFVERGDFGLASGRHPDGDEAYGHRVLRPYELQSGRHPDGGGAYGRTWFNEPVPAEEITFDSGVFLLRKDKAAALKAGVGPGMGTKPGSGTGLEPGAGTGTEPDVGMGLGAGTEPATGSRPEPFPHPSPEPGVGPTPGWGFGSGSALGVGAVPDSGFVPAPEPGAGPAPTPGLGATAGQNSEPESALPSSAAAARTIRVSGDVPPEVWNRLGRTLLPKLRGGAELTLGVEFSATVEGDRADGLVADLKQILADLGLSEKMDVR